MAQYTENTSGIIAAINACIAEAGGTVTSYNHNTGGIIAALLALKTEIASLGGGGTTATVEIEAVAGEALALGEAVYLHTDGKVYKAINDGSRAEATVFGLVKAAASISASATMIVRGSCTGMSGLTVGSEYFLDASGGIATTVTTTSGDYVVNIGQAQSATVLDVDVRQPVLLS